MPLFTLFGWWSKPAPEVKKEVWLEASAIVDMLRNNRPEREIIAAIDKLPFESLNKLLPAYSMHNQHTENPRVPLLRIVRGWMAGNMTEVQAQYANLENHLISRGVNQDFVYKWSTAAKNTSDSRFTEPLFELKNSTLVGLSDYSLLVEYIGWLFAQRGSRHWIETGENCRRIKQLIDSLSPAELNQFDRHYQLTLLHRVASFGMTDLTWYLLKHRRANVNATHPQGMLGVNPLLYTLASPSVEVNDDVNKTADILLAHAADKSIKVTRGGVLGRFGYRPGMTILDICATRRNAGMVVQLIESGVDPEDVLLPENQQFVNDVCKEHNLTKVPSIFEYFR